MLGEQLRKMREAANLTQEQLAFKAEVDRAYISLLEHDKKSPTVATLQRLCHACGTRASIVLAAAEESEVRRSRR